MDNFYNEVYSCPAGLTRRMARDRQVLYHQLDEIIGNIEFFFQGRRAGEVWQLFLWAKEGGFSSGNVYQQRMTRVEYEMFNIS